MSVSQKEENGTRSGLLWEVERLLNELSREREHSTLPQLLLMENVPEVIGANNVNDFNKWLAKLESLGYSNFFQIMNCKDYGGLPQNRRRCFMISILGDYTYDFPLKLPLKYKLKDFLEKEVDEKYFLSDKMVQYITATGTQNFSVNNSEINCSIGRPLTTEQNKRAGTTNYIADDLPENADLRNYTKTSLERIKGNVISDDKAPTITANALQSINHQNCGLVKIGNYGNGHHAKDVYDPKGNAPTITTGNHGLGQAISEGGVMIKENNSKGYKVAKVGDGVNLASRMKHQRGNVQKGSIQTLKTQMEVGVVVNERKTKT